MLIKFLDLESGRLFESGRLLNFHHFQKVKYVYVATKQQKANDKTLRSNKARFLLKHSEENSVLGEVSY